MSTFAVKTSAWKLSVRGMRLAHHRVHPEWTAGCFRASSYIKGGKLAHEHAPAFHQQRGSTSSAVNSFIISLVRRFEEVEGRRPRILMGPMGQECLNWHAEHVLAYYFGFDVEPLVEPGGAFQTPEDVAQKAVDSDVHVIQVAGRNTLFPQLISALQSRGRGDIPVVADGVISPQDYDFLYKAGVSLVFGRGSRISTAALAIIDLSRKKFSWAATI